MEFVELTLFTFSVHYLSIGGTMSEMGNANTKILIVTYC